MSNKKNKLLVVEDDPNLGTILTEYLSVKGFETRLCRDGQEGYDAFTSDVFSLCVLDIMMPVKDGFTLAKEIRQTDKNIPIIFLTAKSMKQDTIEGFRIGADDYITKPFSMEELLMRIKAILRRVQDKDQEQSVFTVGGYEFNYPSQTLLMNGQTQKLTSKENELLRLLCLKKNEVLERTYALKAIWKDDSYFNSRSMDVYIAKLRKYLKEDSSVEILNVHGRGFKLTVN